MKGSNMANFNIRLTDKVREAMQLANQEALRYNHEHIGTEHILCGLLRAKSRIVIAILNKFGIDPLLIRLEIKKVIKAGTLTIALGRLSRTPYAQSAISFAYEEAQKLNHDYISSEHILLGLLRVENGVASQILRKFGFTVEKVLNEIQIQLGEPNYGANLLPEELDGLLPGVPSSSTAQEEKPPKYMYELTCDRCGKLADFNNGGGNCPECGGDLCLACAKYWHETADDYADYSHCVCERCYQRMMDRGEVSESTGKLIKGLTINEAAKSKRRIRRACWAEGKYIEFDRHDKLGLLYYDDGKKFILSYEECVATDWEIVHEQKTMTFQEAVAEIESGKCARRLAWRTEVYIRRWKNDPTRMAWHDGPTHAESYSPTVEDCRATDWIVALHHPE